MSDYTHQTAPTQFVEANGIRFAYRTYLHPNFTVTAPNYLPWGGRHVGAAFFRDHVLPSVTDVFDFARFIGMSFRMK